VILLVIKLVVAVALIGYVMRQCRKPSSVVGRFFAARMNGSHRALTLWGLGHVKVGPDFAVLDVGCGGGRTIATLAELAPRGKISGIDYSSASVEVARATNRAAIAAGSVEIQNGSVSTLPYPDATFDLVTAFETHYYWPSLTSDVAEIRRVLKPGGTFLLVAETYRGRRNDWLYRPIMTGLLHATYMNPAEHRDLLTRAGYENVTVSEEKRRGWITAVGCK
jgi:ubiquinone/menaquinone biosynthesis C-methylase UbiE